MFKLFPILDQIITDEESGSPKAALQPGVWPSEASAIRIDSSSQFWGTIGACHRKAYYRMTGQPSLSKVDAVGAWRWVTGRKIEEHVGDLAKLAKPKIFVASGIRLFVEDLIMPLEIDMVVIDPDTKKAYILECKTIYGYNAAKSLAEDGPKSENLMQTCLYLLEVKNGANLKKLIKESLEKQKSDLEKTGSSRNRIDADLEVLELVDDGPVAAKLIYIARDDCDRTEFEVSIEADFDGNHFPYVNNIPYKIFTIESMYERYKKLQDYWFAARNEGVKRLKTKGITPPDYIKLFLSRQDIGIANPIKDLTKDQIEDGNKYLKLLEEEVRMLPDSFLPPAEYEWSYSETKIEKLAAAGKIGKTKYTQYKKGKIQRMGDWQCGYCPYAKTCIPKQKPELAYLMYDLQTLKADDTDVEIS